MGFEINAVEDAKQMFIGTPGVTILGEILTLS